MTEIHVNRNGEEIGVFDPTGLQLALRNGQVLPTDLAWVPGKTNWMPVEELPDEALEIADAPPLPQEMLGPREFYCVPTWRFIICSFATGGLYTMWWMLQNWHYIRQRDGSGIWPFVRMLFSVIWIFPLASDILRHTGGRIRSANSLGIYYVLLNLSGLLPDPWWVLNWCSFVPLIPLVRQIEQHNHRLAGAPLQQRLFYGRHVVICSLWFVLVLEGLVRFQVTTGSGLLLGAEIKERNITFFQEAGLIGKDEPVKYVYSGMFRALKTGGVILTSERLIAYEAENGAYRINAIALADLQRMNVPERDQFNPQTVEIATAQGSMEVAIGYDVARNLKFIRELENSLPKDDKEDQSQQPDSKEEEAGSSPTDQ